jgi:uncharacterized radical SAM superfamily Fe-S cluster-containing enzyme
LFLIEKGNNMSIMTTERPLQGDKLKETITRCVTCQVDCPGEVWKVDGKIIMIHACPTHGQHETVINDDSRFYWLAKGNSKSSCCSASGSSCGTLGNNAANPSGIYEQLASCVVLIEIVESCNLTCPTCFSESPFGKGGHVTAKPLGEIQRHIDGVIARKGGIEILQLSGGEPTLHPQFFELLEWIKAKPEIQYVFLNSNGVRIASDKKFSQRLEEVFPRGRMLLYLQFDGVTEEGQVELRGRDLRRVRERIISRSAEIGLPVVLVMTVTDLNLPFVFDTVAFGLQHRHVRAVNFQPMFMSGRTQVQDALTVQPITTGHVLNSLINKSNGLLTAEDFTPVPCGDPNCQTIGCLLRPEGKPLVSMRHFIDAANMQGFLKDKVHYDLNTLAQCGCDSSELAALLEGLALTEQDAFFISVKPFMDARTWDKDRTDRCCTHVITRSGEMESFCRYYSRPPDTSRV